MNDLMQKLAISKKIMDKHNQTPRGQVQGNINLNENVNAIYNIPQEAMNQPQQPTVRETIRTNQPISEDAIKNSKLPDEIKKLMMENPIVQPQMNEPVLSNEIIEGASRLMNQNGRNTPVTESRPNIPQNTTTNNSELKQMIRDVVRDTVRDVIKEELQSAGLLSESTQKTNETLSLRVGKHIFDGKVLKIRKVKE